MCSSSQSTGPDEPYDLGTGYNHMAIAVDDIDAASPTWPLGVQPEKPLPPATARPAADRFVADPDGYRIELIDGGRFDTPQDPRLARHLRAGTMSSRPSGQRTQALWPPS